MDYETIDGSQQSLPEEAIKELKSMSKWMTFTGVLIIIFTILGILGNLSNYSNSGNGAFLLSILLNIVSVYLGFMILKKSNLFSEYADNHQEEKLAEGLRINRMYWMLSTIMMIISFLISFTNR
jgi:magnesium-transporting ATPase (P-type)